MKRKTKKARQTDPSNVCPYCKGTGVIVDDSKNKPIDPRQLKLDLNKQPESSNDRC